MVLAGGAAGSTNVFNNQSTISGSGGANMDNTVDSKAVSLPKINKRT
jgi:hypothetical protein